MDWDGGRLICLSVLTINAPCMNRDGITSGEIMADTPHTVAYATRECPFCAEIIRKRAKVCKHCDGVLPVSDKIPPKQAIFDRQR